MILLLISFVFGIITILSLYLRFCYWGRLLARIPGPKGWPLIGHTLLLMDLDPEKVFIFTRDMYKNYGRISQLNAFDFRAVNIYDPEDVETICSTTRFNEKKWPYNFLKPWLCDGLLVSNDDKWKQRRKLLTPAFHFNILRNFCGTFSEETERFLSRLEAEIDKEHTDILPLISKATLNIMCETSMGTSMLQSREPTTNKYFKALLDFGKIVEVRVTKTWFYYEWLYKLSSLSRKEKKVVRDLHEFTDKIIQERKTYRQVHNISGFDADCEVYGRKGRLAMLDLLLENEKEGTMDMAGVREEVDTFLFEGHDTTAMALSFMIMRIANEPHIQDLIYEELFRIFGDSQRSPTTEDLYDMKYLECCIKESLRLYPSVHVLARYNTEDVILGGYTVPANTIIHIHVFDIHRRPDLFPNPEEFIPERFLPQNTINRHPYSYIPFSAGPRNCIGQKFALLEMKTMMSGLLRRYRLEPVTRPEEVTFLADIVLRPKHPIKVRFRERIEQKI